MEDKQNGRWAKWKTTKMKDHQNGRRSETIEDNQNRRRPPYQKWAWKFQPKKNFEK